MIILYISDAASIHTRRWAEFFRDIGVEVHVASFRAWDIPGVTVHVLPTYGLGKIGYLFSIGILRRLAYEIQPDICHAHYVTSYGFLAAAAKLKPLIVTAWGSDVLVSPQSSNILKWFATYALRHADLVTTVAAHMNPVVEKFGIPSERILSIPFGVDTDLFCRPENHAISRHPLRIVSTRSLEEIYSVDTVIQAVQIVRSKGLDVILDIVGDGSLRGKLETLASELGVADLVRFRGRLKFMDLLESLQDAHLFVSTAISDGNNISLNEAMAVGCFPLATNIPANSQWITHGDNGLLFNCGNHEQLAEMIIRAEYEDRFAEVAVKNRGIVLEKADWRSCTARMKVLYDDLIRCTKENTHEH
jgi:glycosyltransferase involved in cell wall biosynthesis